MEFEPILVGDISLEKLNGRHYWQQHINQSRIKDSKGIASLIASQGDASVDIDKKYA